jgi:hypothetical protein
MLPVWELSISTRLPSSTRNTIKPIQTNFNHLNLNLENLLKRKFNVAEVTNYWCILGNRRNVSEPHFKSKKKFFLTHTKITLLIFFTFRFCAPDLLYCAETLISISIHCRLKKKNTKLYSFSCLFEICFEFHWKSR